MTAGSEAPIPGGISPQATLGNLLDDLPYGDSELFVVAPSGRLTVGQLRQRVSDLSDTLRKAGVVTGLPVGTLVAEGATSLVSMFATWAAGGVYVPINNRYTASEVANFLRETPVALLIGSQRDLAAHETSIGLVEVDESALNSRVIRAASTDKPRYDNDVALVLRTSGTTGSPKAVLLRHSGTLGALDSSLHKLRSNSSTTQSRALRMNIIPASLALWAGIYNTTFSMRAGFGVVLMDKFTVESFVTAVREFQIKSTVLAPAMITMLVDASDLTDLSPLRFVRSITAPLSPEVARKFYERFGAFVLNCYGQTELGGEVVGWTSSDVRTFGTEKLGAAGRPYDDVDLRVRDADGNDLESGQYGEIHVNSPFRMRGYALGDGSSTIETEIDESQFVDGYLRTGDMGMVDEDGFVWIQGRVSDMINRGGLKVFPDEVEEALRRHPKIRDAGVAGVPDRRLGEVPYAWVILSDRDVSVLDELDLWCRRSLAPYKIPVGFTAVTEFPRNEIGKLLRHTLAASRPVTGGNEA